ncbi:unnamed protein product [Rotaria sp. Silwood1]|nr:unnamed protein product [Rotaria sp. Silwood1]CAF1587980.1 unnamed protein product [Rotaria sp. Silwood1]
MSVESIRTKSTFLINREKMVLNSSDEHEILSSTMNEDSHTPLSETVTTLASNVYKELERIIKNFGENSVKDLMPVMISTLESLDSALHEREINKLEIESLKEQTEQLYQQYEREKSFHKEYQQRYLQIEDHLEEIKRENEEKLRSLESIVKIFEIKARNTSDHVGRLEDKENEMKQEYKRLHDRYCELFKVHCDYMERTKILYGTDRLDQLTTNANTSSQSCGNLQLSNEKQTDKMAPHYSDMSSTSPKQRHVDNKFQSELEITDGKHTQTESMTSNDVAVNTDVAVSDDDDDDISVDDAKNSEAFDKETRNDNIDISDVDASADLFGMTKEVSNLIKENNELLETKNALNVLKDDLLAKIEELSNDLEIAREEVDSLQTVRSRLQLRITEIDEEFRKTREELEKKKEEEENVPNEDRKRFTRVEMQRVLLERNQYKQRLFELEEAIHRHDALRASRHEQLYSSSTINTINDNLFDQIQNKNRTMFLKLFSGLFGSTAKDTSPKRAITTTTTTNLSTATETSMKHSSINDDQIGSTITTNKNTPLERSINESAAVDLLQKSVATHHDNSIVKDDDNRFQAYDWILPSKNHLKISNINGKIQVNVPVPIYNQSIFNTNDTTQIWCAVGIDLSGLSLNTDETSIDQLNKQLIESYHQMIDEQYLKLSSLIWIAAKSNNTAMITIIDSNKPDKVIDIFPLGNIIIYAIGSVPGTSSTDYPSIDNLKLNEKTSTNDVNVMSCTAASLATGGNRSNTTIETSSEKIRSDVSHSSVDENKTKYPTVWLGSSDGWLYIHSTIGEHRTTIGKVWLRHAIYSIVHVRGRVFVSLANEKLIVFHRNIDGTWNLNNFHLIITGKSRESIRCSINVRDSIWCGVANRVYVIDVQTLEIRKQFQVHSRSEHSVQHITWSGDGVWLSVRLSSTLQLYHAQTYQHLQDVDIQPYIEKMIVTDKTGLHFVHISALTIACRRLWIGTGSGIIISIPLTDSIETTSNSTSTKPGSVVRIYDQISSSNYIPYCNINNAQLSCHGYKDAVKFFVAVPGQAPSKLYHENEMISESLTTLSSTDTTSSSFGDILIVSGGDGYIDFRVKTTTVDNNDDATNSKRHASHLIVWHMGSA